LDSVFIKAIEGKLTFCALNFRISGRPLRDVPVDVNIEGKFIFTSKRLALEYPYCAKCAENAFISKGIFLSPVINKLSRGSYIPTKSNPIRRISNCLLFIVSQIKKIINAI